MAKIDVVVDGEPLLAMAGLFVTHLLSARHDGFTLVRQRSPG